MAEAAKRSKVSEPTIHAWRKHFDQMEPADVKRLKARSIENAKRKKLLADRDFDVEVMKEIDRKIGESAGTPRTADHVWAHDLVFDVFANG